MIELLPTIMPYTVHNRPPIMFTVLSFLISDIINEANTKAVPKYPIQNVVYVKARIDPMKKEKWWKITFVNGEQLHTRNEEGVHSIINAIKVKIRS